MNTQISPQISPLSLGPGPSSNIPSALVKITNRRTTWSLYTFGQLMLVWLLVNFFETQKSFFAQIITADSLFLALNFLNGQDFLTVTDLTIVDKYSYYILISMGCNLMDYLTWSYLTIIWQTLALLSTCPSFQRNFFEVAEIQDIVEWFHQKQKHIIQIVLCYSLSRIINSMTKINLQTDPKISYTELMNDIQLTKNSEPLWKFVKIFLVNTLIKILGNQDSYKMRMLKYFYQRGHVIEIPLNQGSILPTDRELNPKEILKLVVFHRRWHYLYDPRVLNGLIELYQSNHTPYFMANCLEILADLRYRSLKFGTIWTICSVLNVYWIFPLISILSEIHWETFNYQNWTWTWNWNWTWNLSNWNFHWGTWVFKPLGFACYWLGLTGYLMSALITEFAPILDNQASNFLLTGIRERWPKWKLYFNHQNQFNSALLKFTGSIIAIYHLPIVYEFIIRVTFTSYMVLNYVLEWQLQTQTQAQMQLQTPTQTQLIMLEWIFKNLGLLGLALKVKYQDPTRFWIIKWLIIWGWFSNYHPIHLGCLSLGLYLIINLKNYREAPLIKPNINLYHSYYHAGLSK